MIKTKRIYLPFAVSDGYRILVDRLWPRGIKKETAYIDLWMKEVAPSNYLRKWFNHETKKWASFLAKYQDELESGSDFEKFISILKQHKVVTLLYSSRDETHNQAVALKEITSRIK